MNAFSGIRAHQCHSPVKWLLFTKNSVPLSCNLASCSFRVVEKWQLNVLHQVIPKLCRHVCQRFHRARSGTSLRRRPAVASRPYPQAEECSPRFWGTKLAALNRVALMFCCGFVYGADIPIAKGPSHVCEFLAQKTRQVSKCTCIRTHARVSFFGHMLIFCGPR